LYGHVRNEEVETGWSRVALYVTVRYNIVQLESIEERSIKIAVSLKEYQVVLARVRVF
jgi:hypothetical protein